MDMAAILEKFLPLINADDTDQADCKITKSAKSERK
jgi:hypothetical protein